MSATRAGISRPGTEEGPQSTAAADDRDRWRDRRRSIRRLRRGDVRYRTRRLPDLRAVWRADHHGHANAGRDGGGQTVDRIVRRLLPRCARPVGRLLRRLALLVLLGDRRRLRGDRRSEDRAVLVRHSIVVVRVDLHGADDRDEPVLGQVLRRIRVLVRGHQGRRDSGLHRDRCRLRVRLVAGQVDGLLQPDRPRRVHAARARASSPSASSR